MNSKKQKRLFDQGKESLLPFFLLLLLSMSLMFADAHYQRMAFLRHGLSIVVAPLQYAVDYPVRIFAWLHDLVRSKKNLVNENMQLRYKQTLLEAQLQKLLLIRNENSQLRALLQASTTDNTKAMAAEILAVDSSTSRQVIILNKGSRDGVLPGLPVLDARGVMGQVIDVGLMTSTVLLITDSKSAVPIRNNRTGEQTILVGLNRVNRLSLMNLPKSSSIQVGDMLVTSGLGRRYPEGYPVGVVVEVHNLPGEEFIKVLVQPVASLTRDRLVLLIWPDQENQALNEQLSQRYAALDTMS